MTLNRQMKKRHAIACGVNRPILGIFHNKQIDVENTSLVKNKMVTCPLNDRNQEVIALCFMT